MRSTLMIVGVGLVLLACGNSATATTTPNTVDLGDDYFDPNDLTVRAGDTIQWVWSKAAQHTHNVTWDSGPAPLPPPSPDMTTGVYERVFAAGTYKYHCTYHGGPQTTSPMVGILRVSP
jgi:plastocyanin